MSPHISVHLLPPVSQGAEREDHEDFKGCERNPGRVDSRCHILFPCFLSHATQVPDAESAFIHFLVLSDTEQEAQQMAEEKCQMEEADGDV